MTRPTVLALDAMGVVFETRSIIGEVVGPFLAARGVPFDPKALRALYFEASLGHLSGDAFWRRLGVDPALEDACLDGHRPMPGIVPFLERARRTFEKVILLSNDVSRWSAKLRARFDLDRWFDACLVSGDLGVRKPDPAAYAALIGAAGAAPERIVFIDDKVENLRAAARAELRAIHFDADSAGAGGWHAVAPTLEAVEGIIGSIIKR